MLPDKIKLTEDYIALIVNERKKHKLTAYQLSEKIGKNKSWLPNIENHRTKNISRNDFLLIFDDFAKAENLSTELYIIKYLSPDADVTLKDGDVVPCRILQTECNIKDSDDTQFNQDIYEGSIDERRLFIKLKHSLHDFERIITEVFAESDDDTRSKIFNSLSMIKDAYLWNASIANKFYSIDFVDFYDSDPDEYIKEISKVFQEADRKIQLITSKAKVYEFLSSREDGLSLNRDLAMCLYEKYVPFDKIYCLFNEIEVYLNYVYNYVSEAFEYNNADSVDFKKIYSMAKKFLEEFVNIAHLTYTIDFAIPGNNSSQSEINTLHLKINNIYFQIKQLLENKYQKSLPD